LRLPALRWTADQTSHLSPNEESDPGPTAYKAVALPLSYKGRAAAAGGQASP
jgi:hypothetical protein